MFTYHHRIAICLLTLACLTGLLPGLAAADDEGVLQLTAQQDDRVSGSFSRGGATLRFEARAADSCVTLMLAAPERQAEEGALYWGHYRDVNYDVSVLGGRLHMQGTWDPETENFGPQQTSGDPAALDEFAQNEEYRLLPHLSRALGARGITGRAYPLSLPLHHLAMGAARLYDIEVPALDATTADSSTPSWHFDTIMAHGAPAAAATSPLSGFALGTNSSRVHYLTPTNQIVELVITGSESSYNKPLQLAGAPPVKVGSPLVSFASMGSPRIYYVSSSNHVIELWWTGSTFAYNDLTVIAGSPTTGSESSLTGFAVNGDSPRIYYISGANHVIELWWEGSGSNYGYNDLTSIAGAPAPMAASPLTSFPVNSNSPRIYYIDSANHVIELWYEGSGTDYAYNDLTSLTGAPAPITASPLSSFGLNASNPRIYYLSGDYDVIELAWNGGYTYDDLTTTAKARELDHVSALASFQVGTARVFAVGKEGYVQRYWYGTCLSQQGNPCNNDCLGMCGKGCSCWNWVCGNCCINRNCLLHDRICSGCFRLPPIPPACGPCLGAAWVPIMGCGTPTSQCAN